MYTEPKFAMKKTVKKPFEGKMQPFKIIGNVYFVGTYQGSCHIIDTGDGLIMKAAATITAILFKGLKRRRLTSLLATTFGITKPMSEPKCF